MHTARKRSYVAAVMRIRSLSNHLAPCRCSWFCYQRRYCEPDGGAPALQHKPRALPRAEAKAAAPRGRHASYEELRTQLEAIGDIGILVNNVGASYPSALYFNELEAYAKVSAHNAATRPRATRGSHASHGDACRRRRASPTP